MNNPLASLLQMVSSGTNPQQIFQHMVNNNPQLAPVINQMRQSGMSPQQFVAQLARQNNINIQPLVQNLQQRGIKL